MNKRSKLSMLICLILLVSLLSGCSKSTTAEANPAPPEQIVQETMIQENQAPVIGKVYTFPKDNNYQFSSSPEYSTSDLVETYGSFAIAGTESTIIENGENDGVPAYSVSGGNIMISYAYNDGLLSATDDEWHLVDDNGTIIDVTKLNKSIQKGTIVLQKSMDHMNWHNISVQTNVFKDTPIQNGVLYKTTDIEMINGCYYRLMVVYELAQKVGTSTVALVIPKDEIEYKRIAEVYEFYTVNENEHIEPLAPNTKRYSLGETVLVSDFASYSGAKEISKDDLHYGWKLGNFFVSGFTSSVGNKDEVVFLKNSGDVVTLWFNLTQNISALNNDGSLTITPDNDGHDQYFQTPMTNFGKGMLIIRYTDYENIQHDPVMYYDYLLANTMMGANTRVQLFEEGDYEVALDYEVTKSQLLPQTHHYRIFFKFSVRNANCMVYPFDIVTGAELTNSSVTENGFSLDLAKSRYLNLYIKKEVWMEGADGLTEDTRFNTTAKDGDRYTDEGIYTITAKNQYTGIETTKKIYVGTNRILAAYANSNYSIAEIQRMVEQGATIYEDGSISMPSSSEPDATDEPTAAPLTEPISSRNKTTVESLETRNSTSVVAIVCAIVAVFVISVIWFAKKRSGKEGKK